jgi:hypothetical protein
MTVSSMGITGRASQELSGVHPPELPRLPVATAGMGHEDPFPRPRLSARFPPRVRQTAALLVPLYRELRATGQGKP